MNNHDRLLEWASEIGGGTWERWKAVCGVLKLEPNQAARALSALGHVEFDWVNNRFNCAPAVAVLTLHSSGCVLLTGARRRGLRAHLEWLYQDERFNIDLLPPVPQQQGPETWLVEAELGDVERFCRAARMCFEIDSGRRIAEAMPTATLEWVGERERPDPKWPRRWLGPHRRVFRPEAARGGSEGLWWVEDYRRETAFVSRGGEWFRVPVREYGPYVAYPEVPFITYEKAVSTLVVDNRAPLPPLLARAATLQSGRLPLPHGSGSRHAYVNIDEELATLIRDRLNTPIRGIDDDA